MKAENTKPLPPGLVADWKESRFRADKLEGRIVDRMDYIIHKVCTTFNATLETWYFDDARDGEMGHLTWDEPELFARWDIRDRKDMIILTQDGEEYYFDNTIPTRWLFENFEEELEAGKKRYDEREEERLKKRLEATEYTKKLADSAKNKLTKEELRALKKLL